MVGRLQELTAIEPLGERDQACIEELSAVLRKHAAIDRFGLTLLHDHFEVDEHELLIETCDAATRTLSITVERAGKDCDEGRLIETSWRFSPDGDAVAGLVCRVGCFVDLKDRHSRTHQRVNQP